MADQRQPSNDEIADAKPSLIELGVRFCRELRIKAKPERGKPADKEFIDSLYEKD